MEVAFGIFLLGVATAIHSPQTVFLDKQQATSIISRQKRASEASNLEQACMERVCTYDEARKFFQDSYQTDIFWSVYIDGDQCAEKPCKNGAMCLDSVGGYDCVCKSGFSGVHCEKDETLCTLEKNKGCSQFCKPGYVSYECYCARGWKLNSADKNKCEPAVTFPCGKVSSLSLWKEKHGGSRSKTEGVACTSSECPWQALLKTQESVAFCGGVILKERLVLTTAQCASKHQSFQVVVGKSSQSEIDTQTRHVKVVHLHPRYEDSRPENDLAVIELRDRITFKKSVVPACLPEKDFADRILMSGEYPAYVTGWTENKQTSVLQETLALNQLEYRNLTQCVNAHTIAVTNKMGCTAPQSGADCSKSSGSPVLTMYRDVFFLTGIVSTPQGADCNSGFIFQKVSRHLGWLQSLMGSR